MAEPSPKVPGPQERTVTITIKSPGAELPTTLHDIKLRTTISDLKKIIREQSASHPAESRQRLIFHGKPLLRDQQTLSEALGENMVSCVLYIYTSCNLVLAAKQVPHLLDPRLGHDNHPHGTP